MALAAEDVALGAVTGPAAVLAPALLCAVCSLFIYLFIFGRVYGLMSPTSIAESVCDHFHTLYLLDLLFYITHVTVNIS